MKLRLRRRSHETPLAAGTHPTSVHVLRDEEDLRRALMRAAEFDQRAADVLLSRSAHYRALVTDDDGDEAGQWSDGGMRPTNGHAQSPNGHTQ
jgi:hypothetical protein